MGGGDGAAFKRPGDGARLQRVLGLGSRRATRSLPAGGSAPRRPAPPPPPGHASAGPTAMSSHIAKSESKTSLLKAAAASGGSRAPRHGPAREAGLPGRRLPGACPSTPPPSGDPSSRRPLCRPVSRDEGARGNRRGLPQAHCRPREALPAAASRPSPPSPLPPARGRDGEERGLSPAIGLRGSLRAPGRGDSAPAAATEADPFLHRLRPMLSSAFGQVRAAPPARAPWKGALGTPRRLRVHRPPPAAGDLRVTPRMSLSSRGPAPLRAGTPPPCLIQHPVRCPRSGPLLGAAPPPRLPHTCWNARLREGSDLHRPTAESRRSERGARSRRRQTHFSDLWPVPPASDPREQGGWSLGEIGVKRGSLRTHRLAWR
jgi:hypothetical protein